MLARAHVGWGLAVSLLLHCTGIAALTLALPRLTVKPGAIRRVELAIVQDPPPPAATLQPAPPPPAASSEPEPEPEPEPALAPASTVTAAPSPAPKPVQQTPRKPKPVAIQPSKLQNPVHPDPSSDGSALERVLRQIAATTELTQDERRRAMLVVLRTWEDPSGKHSADELIEALLKNVRQARSAQPADKPTTLQP